MKEKEITVNGIKWIRCPSVWTGGAAYFYVAFIPEKRTVICNRETGLWDIEAETAYSPGKGYVRPCLASGFGSYMQAMRSVKKNEVKSDNNSSVQKTQQTGN